MPTIADYLVIRDGSFELVAGETAFSQNFSIPSDLVPGTDKAKAILAYKAWPPQVDPFASTADLMIRVNGNQIGTFAIELDTVRGLWETFPATILNAGSAANFVEYRREAGRIRISDVILWFQRRI